MYKVCFEFQNSKFFVLRTVEFSKNRKALKEKKFSIVPFKSKEVLKGSWVVFLEYFNFGNFHASEYRMSIF